MRVSIEGLPGSGKTALLKLLKTTNNNIIIHIDDDSQDPWSNLINKDSTKYNLGYNINKLLKQSNSGSDTKEDKAGKYNEINNSFASTRCEEINLYENSPYTMQHVASSIMLKNSHIHQEEFKLQEKLINTLGWYPDYIIYLDCSPEVCLQRLQRRSPNHNKISATKLGEMFDQYEWVLDSVNCDIPVFRINANDDIASILFSVSHILNKLNRSRKNASFFPRDQ